MNDLDIPAFLRRNQQQTESTMTKPAKEETATEETVEKDEKVTDEQFLEAARTVKEVDAQLDALKEKRNAASDVCRRYLGRKL